MSGVENDGGVLAWQGPLYNKNKYLGDVGVFYFSHEKLPLSLYAYPLACLFIRTDGKSCISVARR